MRANRVSNDISRRTLLKSGSAAAVTFGAGVSFPKDQALADLPKRGGHMRLGTGHGATTDTLDPSQLTNGMTTALCFTYLDRLTEVDADGGLKPLLCESFEGRAGAREWVFKLRKGIEFHNGKSLHAHDVIASIQHHRGAESKSAVKAIAEQIEEMKAEDGQTVVFRLKSGNADFPFLVSAPQFGIMPAKDGHVAAVSGIGCGGYVVKNFEPGVSVKLERFANYFRDDAAFVESAEMLAIHDATARQTALVTGDLHAIDRVDLKTVHLLEQQSDIEVVDVTGTLHYTLPMRTDTAPFDNNDVRLALKYAIDREEIIRKVLRGYGALANDHPISPSNRYFAGDLPQRAYDPDRARHHLKKAGMENLRVELSAAEAAFGGAVDAAVLYREHAKKAGIDLVVKREPDDGYWTNVWMKAPWSCSFWSGRPTEDWMFTDAYAAGSNWNETYWKNDRFNSLLAQARAELDTDKRRDMYEQMQRLLHEDGGSVVPMFANYVMGLSAKLGHGKIASNWDMDGGKAIERWWFK